MSDIIKLLPDSVANQIAAGEVIQRPSSVVKELVENAVDAGGKMIVINIKDAGRTLIQVTDDGCGMSQTDARMAFERHATSKITSANDLYTLHTMGFRGEALPSIAAVAQIEVSTSRRGDVMGTKLLISGSKVESQTPIAAAAGTTIMVKNLFFNIPVRRKFLKKDSVELSNILREFERLALVNPSIEFSMIHNDVTLHHLLPETMKLRICSLFGKAMEKQLIPVAAETSIVKIEGYVGLPEFARRRGASQFLMVNGRNMRHPAFHKAILLCYERLIPGDRQPHYFINLTVDPESIDVNIHPTKSEIKFENEQLIFQILTAAVKESLNSFNASGAIEFDLEGAPEIPPFRPDSDARPALEIDPTFNPFDAEGRQQTVGSGQQGAAGSRGQRVAGGYNHIPQSLTDWEKLYADFNRRGPGMQEGHGTAAGSLHQGLLDDGGSSPSGADEGISNTLQIKGRYIVSPSRDGLMIIDQHRAHLLVLYEKFLGRDSAIETQQVMFPEELVLSPRSNAVLLSILDDVASMGFELENRGEGRWVVSGVPAALKNVNPSEVLSRSIEAAGRDDQSHDEVRRAVALSMARSAAISGERPLSPGEREQLMAGLLSLPHPRYTPDGNRVFVVLTPDDLSRLC